jgi:hypothetical protein
MPGTMFCVQKATCSVSAKKLSTTRSSTSRPTPAHRYLFLGDDLRRVEDVEGEFVGKRFVEQLQPELPFRKVAGLDRVPQVAPMEIGVGAVDLERLYSSGTCTQVRASGSRE